METLDFALIVIPLTCIVSILVGLVYYYANREEINKRKRAKMIQGFIEGRAKQQAAIQSELTNLHQLYKSRLIDKSTYERMQNVLSMTQEKQRYEALITFNEKNGILKKKVEIPLDKLLDENQQKIPVEQETSHEEQEVDKAELEKKPGGKTPKRRRTRKVKAGEKKELEVGLIVDEGVLVSFEDKEEYLLRKKIIK